jgi:hypothetical protein
MTQIQIRRGNASAWTAANPILAVGELGMEIDTFKIKVGNGSSTWTALSYFPVHWDAVTDKPTVIAAGSTKADARAAIDAASLDVNGRVPVSQLPASLMQYMGVYDAATNTPTLADGTGDVGDVYRVTVGGSRNLGSGAISFSVGDYVIYNSSSVWEKSDTTDAVGTVAGRTGDVTLAAADVSGVASLTGTETLTNKTLTTPTLTNPTVTNYVESVVAIGTVTSASTLSLTNGTVQTATLTASTACTFTMPTATAGKSFVLLLKQAASTGNGTATFTSVKWSGGTAPTITATAGKMDILSFFADGTNWYGSATQNFTP